MLAGTILNVFPSFLLDLNLRERWPGTAASHLIVKCEPEDKGDREERTEGQRRAETRGPIVAELEARDLSGLEGNIR